MKSADDEAAFLDRLSVAAKRAGFESRAHFASFRRGFLAATFGEKRVAPYRAGPRQKPFAKAWCAGFDAFTSGEVAPLADPLRTAKERIRRLSELGRDLRSSATSRGSSVYRAGEALQAAAARETRLVKLTEAFRSDEHSGDVRWLSETIAGYLENILSDGPDRKPLVG